MSSSEEEKGELVAEQADEHALENEAFFVVTNVASAVDLASVNKRLFEDAALRHAQVTFAAIHFAITAATLYVVSIPPLALFQRKACRLPAGALAVATDDVTVWRGVSLATWAVIMLVNYGAL
ncbi:hypothetical protein B0A54_01600 [Friedmanniomyces endolithicus]|uniref:Uncharacterized protein n=1 Tax=Friedmanniomyces endolithicus TaxID=329885 RepID=A0A4U0VGB3_9PEZI|nr:hypothetical protein LTS09_006359 [Friedmanniomyces endolithicus]TKA48108.1 hypothetical protein B0A54_01600 [Friedmanniomyces endolithicus]